MLLDFPSDIKAQICADTTTWIFLAINDKSFFEFTRNNCRLFIKLFTQVHITKTRITTKLFGKRHSLFDEPAVIFHRDGVVHRREWRYRGKLHRNLLPAIVHDSVQEWYQHGKKHNFVNNVQLPTVTTQDSTSYHWKGKLHREDGPALINNTSEQWYYNGKLHRDDQPAVIHKTINGKNKSRIWYKHGVPHRDGDLPAVRHTKFNQDGKRKIWYQNGFIHRDNDLPAIIYADSSRHWYHRNMRHREDGPAVIDVSGRQEWFRFGIRSRGLQHDPNALPAVCYPNGSCEWWYAGQQYDKKNNKLS